MDQKRLGIVLLVISVLVGLLVVNFISETKSTSDSAGCFQNKECVTASLVLNSSHLGVGILFSLFSLAIYLLIFSKSDAFWFKKLEQQSQKLTDTEKWDIIKLMLDENEFKVIKAIKDQPGITQFTLRLRTDLSKSKLSDILTRFEKRGLIHREAKGKTLSVYIKSPI